jgi:hypothetical protein
MLSCENLTKSYLSGGREITVLKGITFAIDARPFVPTLGPARRWRQGGPFNAGKLAVGRADEDTRAREREIETRAGFLRPRHPWCSH